MIWGYNVTGTPQDFSAVAQTSNSNHPQTYSIIPSNLIPSLIPILMLILIQKFILFHLSSPAFENRLT